MKHISSTANPIIKQVQLLSEKASERKRQGLFVLEGLREISLALQAGYAIQTIFYHHEKHTLEELQTNLPTYSPLEWISVSANVFEKIAYRTSGISQVVGLGKIHSHDLSNLKLSDNPLVVVVETVEKPGNLGAILRTADAAGIDALIIADPNTDVYNPNVLRSSVGCFFTCQIAVANSIDIINYLKSKKISIFCAALSASEYYHQTDFTQPSAIILGTEATGLSPLWLDNSKQNIKIPMLGKIDSMNVSNSAAILIYEAQRQRNFEILLA